MPKGTCFADGRDVKSILQEHLGTPLESSEILNHHGLLSLKVKIGDTLYKVAECESRERAILAEKALKIAALANGPVPGVICRTGSVIICKWIHGVSCKGESRDFQTRHALACQEALFKINVPDQHGPVQYIHLESMLARFIKISPQVVSPRRAFAIVENLRTRLPHPGVERILHPDLTPSNIIINGNTPYIIDNEVIAIGAGYEFDVWNSGEAIYGHRDLKRIEYYVRQFHERCSSPMLFEYQPVWDDFRRLRRAMKALEKGRIFKAKRLIGSIGLSLY